MTYARPKGTADLFGKEMFEWRIVEEIIRRLCADFNVQEIRTPMYEYAELFQRSMGETSDVVQKEMFTFTDAGGRLFALRPEGTANAARAFIENGMSSLPMPVKLFYIMPNFRAEKPQKGRLRQHHQFGVEFIGAYGPECEAEVISVAHTLLSRLGIKNTVLHINSLGGRECRAKYNSALKAFLGNNIDGLCPVCRERFVKNPLRVLDCKNEKCRDLMNGAPSPLSTMDVECREHFEGVQNALRNIGAEFIVDDKLVRGLDYYTRTVFEFISSDLGAQSAVCAGGRYDGLIAECGGSETAAVGFGMGIERLLIILEEQGAVLNGTGQASLVFVGHMGIGGRAEAARLTQALRREGIAAERDLLDRGVKAQMKYADKLGASFSLVIGSEEIEKGIVGVKNMRTGDTTEVSLYGIIEYFKNREVH